MPDRPEDSFPPYPLLVSVGQTDDGSFLFLNLEELRTVTVTGDADRKAAFARHLAAELAVNPWSIVTTVDLLGLGSDLASFNLGRVRTHPAGDTDFIGELARNLSSITEPVDPDDFHAVIIASADRPDLGPRCARRGDRRDPRSFGGSARGSRGRTSILRHSTATDR